VDVVPYLLEQIMRLAIAGGLQKAAAEHFDEAFTNKYTSTDNEAVK